MSDSKEKISAYLDDDLRVDEIGSLSHEELESGDDKYGLASRYQMMGDAMRGELGDASMIDISAQLHQALLDEAQDPVAASTRKTDRQGFDFGAWFAPFVKPLGGLAVAASVALVTVIAVTMVESPTEPSNLVAETDSQKVNIPVAAVVPRKAVQPVVASSTVNKANPSRNAAVLDAYLAEHSEFAAQDTMQGRMPYARAVSYESK